MTESFHLIPKDQAPGREHGWYTRAPGPVPVADQRTWLSVDTVAFTRGMEPALVLYRRTRAPHEGELSLPGAVMDPAQELTVATTAAVTLRERAGAQILRGSTPEPVTVVSDAARDERGHTVSIVCVARVGTDIAPVADTVLVRAGEPVPPMPFGHNAMVQKVAAWALDGLLTGGQATEALLGITSDSAATGPEIHALLVLLHHLAGLDPESVPSLNAVRMKIGRSSAVREVGKAPAKTRPETLYAAK